jgi:hypothetical protein
MWSTSVVAPAAALVFVVRAVAAAHVIRGPAMGMKVSPLAISAPALDCDSAAE